MKSRSIGRYIVLFFVVVLMASVFAGCSSKPSASDAQTIVKNLIQKQSNGLIRLVDLKKTNAQEGDLMGVKLYALEYEAVIEFLDSCYWGGPFGETNFATIKGEPGPFNTFMFMGKARANKGEKKTVKGILQFEKTEKGWRGPDGQIY